MKFEPGLPRALSVLLLAVATEGNERWAGFAQLLANLRSSTVTVQSREANVEEGDVRAYVHYELDPKNTVGSDVHLVSPALQ